MRNNSMGLGLMLGLLAGCSTNEPTDTLPVVEPTGGTPDTVSEALEVDQVRKDYDDCIHKLGPEDPTCQNIRWMYEDARSRYEAAKRTKP